MKLLITIDTESDNAWNRHGGIATENAKYLPRFQQLCERYGFKPTYLTAYEMAADDFFVEFANNALKRGMCEIGLHPHAWTSPPIVPLTSDDIAYKPYLIEFPEDIMRGKIKIHTELLEDKFGDKMYSHRAGRWALNGTYVKILREFGYIVDCSVTPGQVWPRGERPRSESQAPVLDFRNFPSEAYFLNAEDISKRNSEGLLEVPMTIIPHYGKILLRLYSAIPQKHIRQAMRAVLGRPASWCRPHRIYRELLRVAKYKIKQKADYIMFMLHSSEFMPGGNPTFRNEKDIEMLYEDIEQFFDFLKNNGVKGVTCRQYYEHFVSQIT